MQEALGSSPAPYTLRVGLCTCNPSIQEWREEDQKVKVRAREMDQRVQYWPYKREDLSSDLENLCRAWHGDQL